MAIFEGLAQNLEQQQAVTRGTLPAAEAGPLLPMTPEQGELVWSQYMLLLRRVENEYHSRKASVCAAEQKGLSRQDWTESGPESAAKLCRATGRWTNVLLLLCCPADVPARAQVAAGPGGGRVQLLAAVRGRCNAGVAAGAGRGRGAQHLRKGAGGPAAVPGAAVRARIPRHAHRWAGAEAGAANECGPACICKTTRS